MSAAICAPTAPPGRSTGWSFARRASRQIKVDGRLYPLGKGLGFAGGASIDSNDPKNLVAWLAGRADRGRAVQAVARQAAT